MGPDRLSPLDASFLHIEDHVSHMHIASVAIFEGPPPPFADIVAMVEAKLDLVPRYRQKVQVRPARARAAGLGGRPALQHRVPPPPHRAARRPGGESELRKLVGRVMAQQLDRSKPLWEIWVVEGLEDGRWAMLSKTHHALVDGVSGTDLLAVIMDLSPDAERPRATPSGRPAPMPSGLELDGGRAREHRALALRAAARRRGRRPASSAGWPATRWRWPAGLFALSGLVRPTPLSSLNGPLGPHRRYAWATTSVDDIKRVRKALGGTFNDVVLACITNGFRELLLSRDEDVERVVRTLVPVSVRPRDDSGKAVGDGTFENKVSAMFAELPVDIEDPVLRLHTITEQMKDLKDSKQAVAGEALTSMSGLRAADAARPGHAPGHAGRPAQREHGHDQRAGPPVPALRGGPAHDPRLPLRAARRARSASASPSSPTTARSTSASPATTTRPQDIDVLAGGIEDGMTQMLKAV